MVTGRMRLHLARSKTRWEIRSARLESATEVDGGKLRLTDVTDEMGIATPHHQILGDMRNVALPGYHVAPGCALADLNGDGYPDIYLADDDRDRLYFNVAGGRFREAALESGIKDSGAGRGVLVFDRENDGDLDILVTNEDRNPDFYLNDGGGSFTEQGERLGLLGVIEGMSAAAADVDGDGFADIFIACYGDAKRGWPSLTARNGEPDRLFIYRDGRYREEAAAADVDDPGWGLACSFADVDGDLDQDLYVANDFGRNSFFRNNSRVGRPSFDDVTIRTLTMDRGFGMSVDFGDYDGDQDLDLYVGNYYWEGRFIFHHRDFPLPPFPAPLLRKMIARRLLAMTSGNSLFENGGPLFRRREKATDGGWCWGSGFFDLDNDGDLDILAANGWVTGEDRRDKALDFWNRMVADYDALAAGGARVSIGTASLHGNEATRLYLNQLRQTGEADYVEAAFAAGLSDRKDGRGLAFGDIDLDGDTDILIANHLESPTLLRNDGPDSSFLDLVLASDQTIAGASVRLFQSGRSLLRHLAFGSTFLSTSEPVIHFGLDGESTPCRIEVQWPDGHRSDFDDVAPRNRYLVRESTDEIMLLRPGSTARPLSPKS